MTANIRLVVDSDSEFAGLKDTLDRLKQQLGAQGVIQTMAFADLKASIVALKGALDNIDADVAGLAKTIDDLKALVGHGMSPDQVTEAQSLLDQAKSQAQAIADRTPDAPPPASPSPSPAPVEPPPAV